MWPSWRTYDWGFCWRCFEPDVEHLPFMFLLPWYHFFWITLKNVEMSFAATRWYIDVYSMQSMTNHYNRWVINDWKFCHLSITHRLHIGFIDVIDFIDEICLECVTFVYTRLMPCRWFCRRPAFYSVWNNASLLYEKTLPSASETRWSC